MRLAAYAGASVALATGVFLKALHQRANFYSACVYLSQSSANLMILTNVCLLAVGFLLFWLQRLLYGPLRPIETEQLYEKAWFAVTETCLAMTIFRGELGAWFLVMFVSLLVGKVWGWIGEGRVEFLEQQPPANPWLFHTRLAISLLLSTLFNILMLKYCIDTVLEQARPDMMVMFGFEFAVLTILSSSTAARYSISLVEIYVNSKQMQARVEERRQDIRAARAQVEADQAQAEDQTTPPDLPNENDINEMELDIPGWEEKGRWVFYLDLLTDFLKLTVYLTFFAILFTFYGLPIHILRDVVVTIRSFGRRIMDFVRYRNATRDMNARYPDASAEEVTREEVCIICREEMTPWQPGHRAVNRVSERLRPKKLPCGHILHFSCLRSWLERQQNCPTCRRPVIAPPRTQGAAGVNQGQQNGGAGQPQNMAPGNQPDDRNAPADGLPRARIYQFGPFRIGFGAGRGDLFNNLHQQIHQNNAPWQQPDNANPGARQIGFGFGFGRPPLQQPAPAPGLAVPTPTPTPASNVPSLQNQLLQMEQQIVNEINSLRITADQLNLVRLLQTELQRLRTLQSQPIDIPIPQSPSLPIPPHTIPSTSHTSHASPTSPTTTRHQFASDPGTPSLGSGDPRLPEGLTLPQGWTLVPLHSAQPVLSRPSNDVASPASGETVPFAPISNGPSGSQLPVDTESQGPSGSNDAAASARDPELPNWRLQSSSLTPDTYAEPSSQEWTDIGAETQKTGPFAISSDQHAHGSESPTESQTSESSSKGKARMATAEDVADDET
ncbi:E3 ubiquitin-protein ligase HRD1 [Aspergillus undulatus]|uniref:E3 ubiquitin-protein ligase HRD1 n=1 Tax=Aspergillus undulatus TaxID=1810928 RepID=UPI003CCE2AFD